MPATPRPYVYQDLRYLGGAEDFATEIFAAIRQHTLFQRLDENDCRLLCCFMHCFEAPTGTEVLTEGMEGDHLLIVFAGKVDVFRLDLSGRPVRLARVGPGTSLGEMSLIDGEKRVATCVTAGECRFAVLGREALVEILQTHPRLANKLLLWLLETCVGRLREMDFRLAPREAALLA